MKRLAYVSYYFPPDGGAGTQRAAKFCKHLPAFGWQCTMFTRPVAAQRGRWNPEDASLLEDVGATTEIIRVAPQPAKDWARHIPPLYTARDWLEPLERSLLDRLDRGDIDAVLLSCSPYDLALLGARLARSLRGIPVVLDLRDPWALDGWRLYGTRREWRLDFRTMGESLAAVSAIIANTPAAQEAIAGHWPTLGARITAIPNGFDADDFAGPPPAAQRDGRFRIVHAGTFHSDNLYRYRGPLGWLRSMRHHRPEPIDPRGRTPLFVLQALRWLRDKGHPLGRTAQLVTAGVEDPGTQRIAESLGVADAVVASGYLPHSESVGLLRQADVLLLPLHALPPGHRSLIVPGKAYEYLAAARPILGCLPQGDARDYVERSGRGVCVEPCDPGAIAAALIELADRPEHYARGALDVETWLTRFERRTLAGQLAALLDDLAPASSSPRCAPILATAANGTGG